MFGQIKRRIMASFLKADTAKIVRKMRKLPLDIQRQHAFGLVHQTVTAVTELENTPGPGAKRDELIRSQIMSAKERRRGAIRGATLQGAADHSDPNWASAALLESWLMANSGEFGRDTFETIDSLISNWIRASLTAEEIVWWSNRAKSESKPAAS